MRKLARVAASIAVTTLLLTGVATAHEADRSADEIVTDAAAALQSARSVSIRGSISTDDGSVSSHAEHTLVVREGRPLILTA